MKGFALGLTLKQRRKATRKSPNYSGYHKLIYLSCFLAHLFLLYPFLFSFFLLFFFFCFLLIHRQMLEVYCSSYQHLRIGPFTYHLSWKREAEQFLTGPDEIILKVGKFKV